MSPSRTTHPARPSLVIKLALATALVAMTQAGLAANVAADPVVGELVLVSASTAGEPGNNTSSYGVSTSGDGRFVAFASMASNLDEADQDLVVDVFVKDLRTGELHLVSRSADGTKGNAISDRPSISADGQRVAFVSAADNLSPDDTDGFPDVFVKDLVSGEITVASRTEEGTKAAGGGWAAALSADGSAVAFASKATNLSPESTDGESHVYVKRLDSGSLALADGGTFERPDQQSGAGDPALSADGQIVAFATDADGLDPADVDQRSDIYVNDLRYPGPRLASLNSEGTKGNSPAGGPSLSGDGTLLAFETASTNLVPDDTDPTSDIYVKDLTDDSLRLGSTDANGIKADQSASYPALSTDGTFLTFSSDATSLGIDTPLLVKQIYRKNLESGELLPVSVSADGAPGDYLSIEPSIADDGSVVAFYTPSTNLVDDGGNRASDVLARIFDNEPPPTDVVAPTVELTATPPLLPANRGDRNVVISGTAGDDVGVAQVSFDVIDEYGQHEPLVEPYVPAGEVSSTWERRLPLETSLKRGDHVRIYTISATATDLAGNSTTTRTAVLVWQWSWTYPFTSAAAAASESQGGQAAATPGG